MKEGNQGKNYRKGLRVQKREQEKKMRDGRVGWQKWGGKREKLGIQGFKNINGGEEVLR